LGGLIYAGALDRLSQARAERLKRLKAMADKMPISIGRHHGEGKGALRKKELLEKIGPLSELFQEASEDEAVVSLREGFLAGLERHHGSSRSAGYLEVVKGLAESVSGQGTRWLQAVVDRLCLRAGELMPSMDLFKS